MRKLLLASVAMLGGTVALVGVANAQVAMQYNNVTAASPPWPNVAPTQAPAVGAAFIGSPGAYSTPIPSFGPPLSPGNVSVRIVGRMLAYFGAVSDSGQNAHVTPVNPGTTGGTVSVGSPQANTKLAPYGAFEYSRLYPSFDAVAANGVKYGAFLEIRQDQQSAAGGGANGSISGAVRSRSDLYFRRETSYIGTDNLGFLRFGSTDQPTSLMLTGNFENFDDGGWNGDPALITGNAEVTWPYEDVGNLYTTTKIVYMSPQFFNMLDFGISYEPSTANTGEDNGPGNCPYGVTSSAGVTGSIQSNNALGCDNASSTSNASETGRRRNTIDAVVRLRTAFGPLGFAGTVGTIQSGKVLYGANAAPSTPTQVTRYNGLSVIDVGLQMTYGGIAFGGHFLYGRVNGQWSLQPKGGVNAFGPLVGASYTFGSNVIGFHAFEWQTAGSWNQPAAAATNGQYIGKTRGEYGLAIGDTFTLAPGAYLFLSYLYGLRHQNGVDLLSGAVSSAANGRVYTNNNTRAQALFVGTMFRW